MSMFRNRAHKCIADSCGNSSPLPFYSGCKVNTPNIMLRTLTPPTYLCSVRLIKNFVRVLILIKVARFPFDCSALKTLQSRWSTLNNVSSMQAWRAATWIVSKNNSCTVLISTCFIGIICFQPSDETQNMKCVWIPGNAIP